MQLHVSFAFNRLDKRTGTMALPLMPDSLLRAGAIAPNRIGSITTFIKSRFVIVIGIKQ
jgi:hypothetical protein